MLRRMMDAKGLSQEGLADILDCSRQTVSAILLGKSGITPEMAIGLGTVFANDASDWLKWDAAYQLTLVTADKDVERRARLYGLAPVRDMQKRGWIRDTGDLIELEAELEKFFGGSIDDGVAFPVATSRTITLADLNP